MKVGSNEEVQTEVPETTETPAADATPAASEGDAAKEGSAETATDGDSTPDTEGEGDKPAAPAYKPREKFKVMEFGTSEQKELDVPALLKPLMKDATSEKEVMDLLEKAYGLEPVKQSRAKAQEERDKYKGELGTIQKSITELRTTFQRGDIDMFLQKLSIPPERMLQWALDKVNYSQLPPDQQRVLDERQEAQRRAWAAEQQLQQQGEQTFEQQRQAKQLMLQSSLARPDVQAFATAFNAKAGKPDAFFEEVRATGEQAWNQSQGKVDLSPEQAIEQVMKKWTPFLPSAQAQPSQAAAPMVEAPATTKPAVIPNISGRAQSPVKAGPRSIDDLKKIRDTALKG